jgi:DnaK suppressor protein
MEISERLRQELQDATTRLRRLAADIAAEEIKGHTAGSESVTDVVDAAQGAADRDMHFATRSLLQARAKRLASALARLDSGRYGVCDECGEDIAPARLAAMPEVTACVRCQERRERTGRYHHGSHHPLRPVHDHRPRHGSRGRRRAAEVSA